MKKFKVPFTHTVEHYYVATVEAETEQEALKKVENDPFYFVPEGQQPEEQGIEIEISHLEIETE